MRYRVVFTILTFFSGILVGWFALFMLAATIYNFICKFAPNAMLNLDDQITRWIRKWITLPPTFNYHHSTPFYVGRFSFNIPTRFATLIICGFVILDFIFLFLDYHVDFPNFAYPTKVQQISVTLAHRVAIIGITLLPLLVLFGGRNNFLLWTTGLSLDTFNVFHRWLGRISVIHYIIHGVCWTVIRCQQKILDQSWKTAYWIWGFVSLMCGGIIIFQSLHVFRRQKYDLFLTVHLLLAIGWILGAWYHLKITRLDRNYMFATITVWSFDRFMRVIRILWSGVKSKATITLHEGDVINLKINYSNRWKHYPGCFVFIYVLRPNRFWESHPFTVMVPPKPVDSNKLQITLKVKKGFTKHTKDFLLDSCVSEPTATIPVLVEGPYGRCHNLHLYDSVILIAGGIGVTSTYSYAYDLIKNCPNQQQKITFIWYMHDESPLVWFGDELELMENDPRVTIRLFIKHRELGASASSSLKNKESSLTLNEKYYSAFQAKEKTDVKSLVTDAVSQNDPRIAFLCCGPGRMNDDIRTTISKNLSNTTSRIDYFEESFSW